MNVFHNWLAQAASGQSNQFAVTDGKVSIGGQTFVLYHYSDAIRKGSKAEKLTGTARLIGETGRDAKKSTSIFMMLDGAEYYFTLPRDVAEGKAKVSAGRKVTRLAFQIPD